MFSREGPLGIPVLGTLILKVDMERSELSDLDDIPTCCFRVKDRRVYLFGVF